MKPTNQTNFISFFEIKRLMENGYFDFMNLSKFRLDK